MIPESLITGLLDDAVKNGADFAELFCEHSVTSLLSFLDRKVKNILTGEDFGCGVRLLFGKAYTYAYTSDVSERGLNEALHAALDAGKSLGSGAAGRMADKGSSRTIPVRVGAPQTVEVNPADVSVGEKVEFAKAADAAARDEDDLIVQVNIAVADRVQRVLIANSSGIRAEEERSYVRVSVSSVAEKDGERQTGYEVRGKLGGFEFIQSLSPEELGRKGAVVAGKMVRAGHAPAGKMPVVVGRGGGGVIFHEACGHALETTSLAKKASVFADKLGTRVAQECVTAVDDGTIHGLWGSTGIDDEGERVQRTTLIEHGILKSYLVDKLGRRKMDDEYPLTGSGRRQSYRFAPTSRMRNTFIAAGGSSLEELISSVDHGLYAKKIGGGSVDPATGDFNFGVVEAYMIRSGKVAEPVRGALLIGKGVDVLSKIAAVADDLDHDVGFCGSVSGAVPVTVGQPSALVSEIVVGGRDKG